MVENALNPLVKGIKSYKKQRVLENLTYLIIFLSAKNLNLSHMHFVFAVLVTSSGNCAPTGRVPVKEMSRSSAERTQISVLCPYYGQHLTLPL